MRVVVTGAAGQVGTDLVDALRGTVPIAGAATALLGGPPVAPGEFEVVALSRSDVAIEDGPAVLEAMAAAAPDVVVHLAAYTAVDRAETEPELAFTVNRDGTANVAAAADRAGAHLIYTSTDYVFDGTSARPYREDDPTNPTSVYGASKLAGEHACPDTATIARVSWVAGFHGRNIVRLATERASSGTPMRFVADQHGCPSFAADLAAGLVTLVRERPGGIVHLTNQGATTWFDLVEEVARSVGADPGLVTAITTAELDPQPRAARPANSVLHPGRLLADGYDLLPAWQEALHRLVDAYLQRSSPVEP
jgi:dTDP-4-dehydrorhamnose reductase